MLQKIKVLAVDDNKANLQLCCEVLSEVYQVDSAENGNIALKKLRDNDYDVVLLDVNMPKFDGYKVCGLLRQSYRNEQVPVIFVSALISLNDKIKGYEAGGQDYIEKPVVFEELIKKIELNVDQYKKVKLLGKQIQYAKQAAITAVNNSSELGIILNFMERTFEINCTHELLKAIAKSVSRYRLNCCVQIRTGEQAVNISSTKIDVSRLERDLLSKSKESDRIVTLGERGIFNTPRVSILIRNMPVNDELLYHRLVDHIAVIVTAADERCKHIELQQEKVDNLNKAFDEVVDTTNEECETTQIQFAECKQESARILSVLQSSIQETLQSEELTEQQREKINQAIQQCTDAMKNLSEKQATIENSFERIKSSVSSVVENGE